MPETATVASARKDIEELMSVAAIPMTALEADRLLSSAMGVSRAFLHAHPERAVGGGIFAAACEYARRRASGEPLAYILGDSLFCGRKFFVDKNVLIPRTETEILTEMCRDYLEKIPGAVFADWCSGSGAVAITLLEDIPSSRAYAVDSSRGALEVAGRNAELRGARGRITLIECAHPPDASGTISGASLDMIVANPPYIPTGELRDLETQVRDHEPREALDGGHDGLRVVKLLLENLPFFMKRGAALFMETGGEFQAERAAKLAEDLSPELALRGFFPDHREIKRFVMWRKL